MSLRALQASALESRPISYGAPTTMLNSTTLLNRNVTDQPKSVSNEPIVFPMDLPAAAVYFGSLSPKATTVDRTMPLGQAWLPLSIPSRAPSVKLPSSRANEGRLPALAGRDVMTQPCIESSWIDATVRQRPDRFS
jgi:hypothetical protein